MAKSMRSRNVVQLDPERLADVIELAQAIRAETKTDIDPGALRSALRTVTRGQQRASAVRAASGRLLAAVERKRLSDADAGVLAEVLTVLDLALEQAEEAGTCLPILAGIGLALVDVYQDALAAG